MCKKTVFVVMSAIVTAKRVISLKIQQNNDLSQRVTLKNVDFSLKPLKLLISGYHATAKTLISLNLQPICDLTLKCESNDVDFT